MLYGGIWEKQGALGAPHEWAPPFFALFPWPLPVYLDGFEKIGNHGWRLIRVDGKGVLADGDSVTMVDGFSGNLQSIHQGPVGAGEVFDDIGLFFFKDPGVPAGYGKIVNLNVVVSVSADKSFVLIGAKRV